MYQLNMTSLEISTGERKTSSLFTSMTETRVCRETTLAKWSGRDLNPRPQDFKSAVNHSATLIRVNSLNLFDSIMLNEYDLENSGLRLGSL